MSEWKIPETNSSLSTQIDSKLKSVFGQDYSDFGPDFSTDFSGSLADAAQDTQDPLSFGQLSGEILLRAILGEQIILTLEDTRGDEGKLKTLKRVLGSTIERFNQTSSALQIPPNSSDDLPISVKLKAFARNQLGLSL